jgi:hypothetical protein
MPVDAMLAESGRHALNLSNPGHGVPHSQSGVPQRMYVAGGSGCAKTTSDRLFTKLKGSLGVFRKSSAIPDGRPQETGGA